LAQRVHNGTEGNKNSQSITVRQHGSDETGDFLCISQVIGRAKRHTSRLSGFVVALRRPGDLVNAWGCML
jgi:hypothetical protein